MWVQHPHVYLNLQDDFLCHLKALSFSPIGPETPLVAGRLQAAEYVKAVHVAVWNPGCSRGSCLAALSGLADITKEVPNVHM